MNSRTKQLAERRKARRHRADAYGVKFMAMLDTRNSLNWPIDPWLAYHVGSLTQRVTELEARLSRLEGRSSTTTTPEANTP